MRRKIVFIVSLIVLLSSVVYVRFNTVQVKAPGAGAAQTYIVEMLWNNSMAVYDVAVSKDGRYVAAVNGTGLYYFASINSNPRWWYLPLDTYFRSVAISADGEYVVAGANSGYLYYFADANTRVGNQSDPTWTSVYMGGPVERDAVDISDDGDYVAAGGTGPNVFYFANCTQRSGSDQGVTWGEYLWVFDILAVDLSPDGKYLALGGTNYTRGFVAYYKNADVEPHVVGPDWLAWTSINSGSITDLAVSDDGYAVCAVGLDFMTLYYWANSTTLSGDPGATWTGYGYFGCVDMSADGDSVVAGGYVGGSLHFWSDARELQGQQVEDWVRLESANVFDVGISSDGGFIAASGWNFSNYMAYFFRSDGSMIAEFDLLQYSSMVSMSGSGNITAVGGPGWDSLYVFGSITDSTPPLIEGVYQQPANTSVQPTDKVIVYANVTDDLSGVKQVILNYTTGNGTWFTVEMSNLEGNQYNGTISGFPYCTNVTFIIIAEDNFNNTITTEEMGYTYWYHVIPELSAVLILPLFITATLLTIMMRKRKPVETAEA